MIDVYEEAQALVDSLPSMRERYMRAFLAGHASRHEMTELVLLQADRVKHLLWATDTELLDVFETALNHRPLHIDYSILVRRNMYSVALSENNEREHARQAVACAVACLFISTDVVKSLVERVNYNVDRARGYGTKSHVP